jgi:hypothetical protein
MGVTKDFLKLKKSAVYMSREEVPSLRSRMTKLVLERNLIIMFYNDEHAG